ncbi:MAG: hypothetical protein K2I07_00140 [Lachnospiraceae bacterium]|nr:hypothetical protein [Lachnospiraceae bacterium]
MMHVAMLAAETTPTTVESGIDKLISLLPKATSIATAVWDFGMANPLIAIGVVCSVIIAGVGVIASVRHGVR